MTTETKTLKVVGDQKMHCGGCENTVEFTLKEITGVQQVEADHKTQLIKVVFDPQDIDMGKMQQELVMVGYQVAEAEQQ